MITQDVGLRGAKKVSLKATVDAACAESPGIEKVLVVRRTGDQVAWQAGRDVWWHEALASAAFAHDAVAVEAEHPLFVLYTSGSRAAKGLVPISGATSLRRLPHARCSNCASRCLRLRRRRRWITGTATSLRTLCNGAPPGVQSMHKYPEPPLWTWSSAQVRSFPELPPRAHARCR